MPRPMTSLCLVLLLLLAAAPAHSAALPPGVANVVPNALHSGGGTAIMSQDLPFELDDGLEFFVTQRLRTETLAPSGGELRQYELTVDILNQPGSSGAITSLGVSGLTNAENLDVSFNDFAAGNRVPSTASRSADGDLVTFTFSDSNEIDPGASTRDLRLRFDAVAAPTVVGIVETVNGTAVPIEVVFYQPGQVPGTVTPAWVSATTTGSDGFATYDRFVVAADAPIGAVRWEGFYAPGTSLIPNTTSWELTILGEQGTLASWTLPAAQVSVTPIGSATFGGTVSVFRFDATLPTSFLPTPGTPYWLVVLSFAPTTNPGFHWSVGEGGDGDCLQDETGVTTMLRDGDRAFTLFVPEPSGLLSGGVVAAALLGLAQRRRSPKG